MWQKIRIPDSVNNPATIPFVPIAPQITGPQTKKDKQKTIEKETDTGS
jgi:hypothetical protein